MTSKLDELSLLIGKMTSSIETLNSNTKESREQREEMLLEINSLKHQLQSVHNEIQQSQGRITILEPQVEDYKRLKWIVVGGLGIISVLASLGALLLGRLLDWAVRTWQ